MEYRVTEVCGVLGISQYTLANWYRWEKTALEDGTISERILPVPTRLSSERGKPRVWSSSQLYALIEFQNNIVIGRNGKMGKITNPTYKKK